jgi:hypothetical protein
LILDNYEAVPAQEAQPPIHAPITFINVILRLLADEVPPLA